VKFTRDDAVKELYGCTLNETRGRMSIWIPVIQIVRAGGDGWRARAVSEACKLSPSRERQALWIIARIEEA